MDPDTTDETLYSPASPIVQATGDKEQPTSLGSTGTYKTGTRQSGQPSNYNSPG